MPLDWPPATSGPDRAGLHRALLAWFAAHRRDLPWRRERTLYGTWISEMMLQQTTVATVVPYWVRFVGRFPDVAALAAASEEEVLAHWSGLGYYRRARQLHAAARLVMGDSGGVLPADLEGWRRLPGVGPYAAGAIVSLGLDQAAPAVDANVRRVLGRWQAAPERPAPLTAAACHELARALVPDDRSGDWNEALMELGALVCQARSPACGACPVAAYCGARRHGLPAEPAANASRPATMAVQGLLVALVRGDRLWLEPAGGPALVCPDWGPPARDDFRRLHQGLLTLPMSAWYRLPTDGPRSLVLSLGPRWHRALGFGTAGPLQAVGTFRHAITRYRLQLEVAVAAESGTDLVPNRGGAPAGSWVPLAGAGDIHISQLARKALRLVLDARG